MLVAAKKTVVGATYNEFKYPQLDDILNDGLKTYIKSGTWREFNMRSVNHTKDLREALVSEALASPPNWRVLERLSKFGFELSRSFSVVVDSTIENAMWIGKYFGSSTWDSAAVGVHIREWFEDDLSLLSSLNKVSRQNKDLKIELRQFWYNTLAQTSSFGANVLEDAIQDYADKSNIRQTSKLATVIYAFAEQVEYQRQVVNVSLNMQTDPSQKMTEDQMNDNLLMQNVLNLYANRGLSLSSSRGHLMPFDKIASVPARLHQYLLSLSIVIRTKMSATDKCDTYETLYRHGLEQEEVTRLVIDKYISLDEYLYYHMERVWFKDCVRHYASTNSTSIPVQMTKCMEGI